MTHRPGSRVVATFLVLAAGLGVAACGGSSSTNAQTAGSARGVGGFTSREVAARDCLDKHGVLPARPRGPFSAGDTLASRIRQRRDSPNLMAAFRACGVGSAQGPSLDEVLLPGKTLMKYVDAWTACIARNGYRLPPPNTSGEGPVFPVGIARISKYRAAATHCLSIDRQQLTALRLAAQS